MKKHFFLAWAVTMTMIVSLCGCSGNEHLLDTIPADAPGIVTINVHRLMDAMNGTAHGGNLSAEETLDRFLINSSERCHREITTILTSGSIERDLMAGFAISGKVQGINAFKHPGEYVYTFKIKNLSALISEIGADPNPKTIDGFEVYALEDVNLAVKGKQGWLIWGDPAKAVSTLAAELNRAANTPVSSLKGIDKFLSDDDDIFRLAIARSTAADGWTCIKGDVDDNARKLEIDAKFLDGNGKEKDMDAYLGKINTSLLDYTMPSDIFVMAIGIKGDTDWDGMLEYAQSIYPLDYRQRALMGIVLPYLKRLDGTIMIAAGLDDASALNPSSIAGNINFTIAIQMRKDEVKKTMSDLRDIISMVGLPIVDKGDEFVMQSPGMAPISLKADGNSIILSNRSLKQLGNNAARDAAKGNSFAIWTSIPNSVAETIYGGKGFNLKMELEDDFEMEFSFTDSSIPVLEQIALLMAADSDSPENTHIDSQLPGTIGFTPIDTVK
ncbi:MAG: DUF4836 family protein [Lachnospiraceae bacterium]|nr:DUF4836 family protein [Lachnospiraceae bacterium]